MMNCRIEKICGGEESAWMIALPADAAAQAVVHFAALYLEKVKSIRFEDRRSRLCAEIVREKSGKQSEAYAVRLGEDVFPIEKVSLEAVVAMLTDVAMYGWYSAAHVDIEVENGEKRATVCFGVKETV